MDVIEIENGGPDRPRRKRDFALDYDKAPALGTVVSTGKHGRLTLFRIEARARAVERHGPLVLRWRSAGGLEYSSGLQGPISGPRTPLAYRLNLTEPPEIGTVFECQHGPVTLVAIEDRKRCVEQAGRFILRWRCRDGLEYSSGLSGCVNLKATRKPVARKPRPARGRALDVDFDDTPEIGTMLSIRGQPMILHLVSKRVYRIPKLGPDVLHWRDRVGQNFTSPCRGWLTRTPAMDVRYLQPPEVGTVIQHKRGEMTLCAAEPYRRKRDGVASFILRWRCEDGTEYTSGLRGILERVRAAA
ncbi:hypothetical protein E4L95_15265 [Paracoccus liaowanqingii]|uniref:Uncharacterized protein n=1 Tax=Paracoccus liaowanqingii TaxID=2560053 RepID=A0A4Z1BIT0_9RHOB|nr:hypothetical protein [Paracoccus liaowanqingii]TGN54893.1 hypothetical protein E4L95_15265 [Paracoccus liaowanqingii]